MTSHCARQCIVDGNCVLTSVSTYGRLTYGCLVSYFSVVFGVLSMKSSMVNLPAGCSPTLTSRKTRGRCTFAIVAVVDRPKCTAASEDRWQLELSHATAGFLPEVPTAELPPVHASSTTTWADILEPWPHIRPWYRSQIRTPSAIVRRCREPCEVILGYSCRMRFLPFIPCLGDPGHQDFVDHRRRLPIGIAFGVSEINEEYIPSLPRSGSLWELGNEPTGCSRPSSGALTKHVKRIVDE